MSILWILHVDYFAFSRGSNGSNFQPNYFILSLFFGCNQQNGIHFQLNTLISTESLVIRVDFNFVR